MKKFFFFALLILVSIFFIAKLERESERVSLVQRSVQRSHPIENTETSRSTLSEEKSMASKCRQTNPIAKEKRTYAGHNEAHSEALLNKAYNDPSEILAIAEQDPEAYVALYNLTTSCFPELMRPGLVSKRFIAACPNVIMKLKGHPIQLLERAAELGSVDAKLSFAMNARLYKKFYVDNEGGVTKDYSQDVLSRAEKYGVEAATAGHPDAYRYMSQAYENGIFGTHDNAKALAFMLPLEKGGLPTDKERINKISSKLSEEERSRANPLAFGCKEELSDSVSANPFQ